MFNLHNPNNIIMKSLYKNCNYNYCSETVSFNGNKFKIESKNGNSYCRTIIYIYTKNGELAEIACGSDLNGHKYVNYVSSEEKRLKETLENIELAKKYIKAIYK